MKFLRSLLLLITLLFISCSQDNNNVLPINKEESKDDSDIKDTIDDDSETPDIKDTDTTDNNSDTEKIKYGENFIVFEPDITNSNLDLWTRRVPGDTKYHLGTGIEAINKGYLEFTGNNKNSGPPTSPLKYKFKCPKDGKYRLLMRMFQPLKDGEPEDKRNDVFIKLIGDFTTACKYPTEDLKKKRCS